MRFLVLSEQKLWRCDGDAEPEAVDSPFARDYLQRAERAAGQRGWIADRDRDNPMAYMNHSMVWGAQARRHAPAEARFVDAVGDGRGGCFYFVDFGAVRGLFHQNADGREARLFHRNDLAADGFDWHPEREAFVFAGIRGSPIAHLALMDRFGKIERWLTEGEAHDARPSWDRSRPARAVYQSAGIGRTEHGFMQTAPHIVMSLDLDSGEHETLWERPGTDLLLPRIDRAGRLYVLSRPAEGKGRPWWWAIRETAMLPVRLAQTIFMFVDLFSRAYSRAPLLHTYGTAGNPPTPKRVEVLGRMLDAETLLAKQRRPDGMALLAPSDWTLLCREPDGTERVVARNVSWFTLAADDTPLYTTGLAIHAARADGEETLWRGRLVEAFTPLG